VKKITIMMMLLAAGLTAHPLMGADDDFLFSEDKAKEVGATQGKMAPVYRPYFYNYPHAIPSDYAFRTGRVFSVNNMRQSMLPSMALVKSGATPAGAELGQGKQLNEQVGGLCKKLLTNAREGVADEYAVMVSTFVNLNNLYATSSLGRYLAEQMIGELQLAGVEVVEVRKSPGILVSRNHGEYGLSRDMDELAFVQPVQAMVVGTYSVTDGEIFVNARLLRNEDNVVISSAAMVLPVDNLTARLLADEAMPLAVSRAQVGLSNFDQKTRNPR